MRAPCKQSIVIKSSEQPCGNQDTMDFSVFQSCFRIDCVQFDSAGLELMFVTFNNKIPFASFAPFAMQPHPSRFRPGSQSTSLPRSWRARTRAMTNSRSERRLR